MPGEPAWSHLAGRGDAEVRAVPEGFKAERGYLRCALDLQLDLVFSSKDDRAQALDRAVEAAAKNITGTDFEFLYKVPREEDDGEVAHTSGFFATSLNAFAKGELSDAGAEASALGSVDSPLNLELFAASSTAAPVAPVLKYEPTDGEAKFECETVAVHLDAIVTTLRHSVFDAGAKASVAAKLAAQLGAMKAQILAFPQEKAFKVYQYSPAALSYVVGIAYPDVGSDEMKLFKRRQALHKKLLLPLDRPLIRLSNALTFGEGSNSFARKLMNVHEALGPSGVKGGTQYLVKGTYCYFHYMQDRFDDAGWGCAYRSLQTIISWFVLNNYVNNKVPGHRDIQQTLVNIGDKPATFVGSKQWIGAIEISFILDTLLDISSKVITFNSGAEIPTKAREIAHHFETQGTPIMIGGGVLAYTLLGIDYNESTGECAFLILDPHYTEGEDIKKITGGAWVGWKRLGDNAAAGGDLFVKTAFYNFLCPQRPVTV